MTDHQEQIAAARQAMADGKTETAARIAAALLEFSPDYLDALEIKALAEIAGGDDAGAEVTLRRAIALAPSRRWPYGDLARLLLRLGQTEEAKSVAHAALAADAGNADAHAILGSLLVERGAPFEGACHLRRALELAGPHPQLLTSLGLSLLRQGRLDEARPALKQAIAADANALEPVVHLAELEERLGYFAEAERLLDRAQQIARSNGTDVDLQRSVLIARMNRPQQALALLESKTGLSGAALLQRGRLRDRLGSTRTRGVTGWPERRRWRSEVGAAIRPKTLSARRTG